MRGSAGLTLSGIILKRIFEHNQLEFTKADPRTIPTIAVVEEAQSVLNSSGSSGEGPYIEWVKEGRKYHLGAVLITQQPGSIPIEILSQGDNWFIFHLLAANDLAAAKRANAHFSDDLLSSLLNEPIEGNGIFWSSASKRPIPIPFRALSFESMYRPIDQKYSKDAVQTYASKLKERFRTQVGLFVNQAATQKGGEIHENIPIMPELVAEADEHAGDEESPGYDVLEVISQRAVVGFRGDEGVRRQFQSKGITWRGVIEGLKRHLPQTAQDRDRLAHGLVIRAMTEVYGQEDQNWRIEQRPKKDGSGTTPWFIKL
jgi:hypothetical protein